MQAHKHIKEQALALPAEPLAVIWEQPAKARPVLEKAGHSFVIFFVVQPGPGVCPLRHIGFEQQSSGRPRYITIIVFAVTKVIGAKTCLGWLGWFEPWFERFTDPKFFFARRGAIFLKDTLDAAQADAEHLVVDRLRALAQQARFKGANRGTCALCWASASAKRFRS